VAHITPKMLWVCSLLHELGLDALTPMQMHCESHATIFIVSNLFSMSIPNILWLAAIFQDLLIEKQIVATYVRSNDHMGDILAKPLLRDSFQ
jgi:hypothetical protein